MMSGCSDQEQSAARCGGGPSYDPNRGLLEIFADWVAVSPEAPALVAGERVVSYAELDMLATRVAAAMIRAGVHSGDRVGLYAHRSIDAVIATLGLLRAGAAYVPLDPTHASEQLGFIATDLGLTHSLVLDPYRDEAAERLPDMVQQVSFADAVKVEGAGVSLPASRSGEDTAYVMYTSGTTGTPKGVVVPHRAVVAYAHAQPYFMMRPDDVVMHFLTIACDGATFDIWAGLLNGASVAVVEAPHPSLDDIAETMQRHRVTAIGWYAGIHHMMIDHRIEAFKTVRLNISGGDVMSADHVTRLLARWPHLCVVNSYGPTETCVGSLNFRVCREALKGDQIPIGRPYRGDEAFVVDEALRPLPPGETGQLAIAGAKVASGYHNRPEKSAEVFVPDPRPGRSGTVYLTGDLAAEGSDGVFRFMGRADRQVKLGGRRIELDGVEHMLRGHPGVMDAAVVLIDVAGSKRMAAALLRSPEADRQTDEDLIAAVLEVAAAQLGSEVLPRLTRILPAFPLTSAGKVDRSALAAHLTELASPSRSTAPSGAVRDAVQGVWQSLLGGGPYGDDVTFFEAGGTSLQLIEAHAMIEARLGLRFDITEIFAFPRLGDLARHLSAKQPAARRPEAAASAPARPRRSVAAQDTAIAITGMAARLPGVSGLDGFWQAIREGRNLIPRFGDAELEDDPANRTRPGYVPVRPVLDGVEDFDAKYWGMMPREAQVTDPQHRVFLELCLEALEQAGIDSARAPGPVGVWAGCSSSTYLLHNLLHDRAAIESYTDSYQLGDYNVLTGNSTDSLATLVAYKLDLRGPAITLGTACSSGLTAIAEAVQALRSGVTDVALAGGISITFPQRRGYLAQEGGMASPDGLCRPFDADANGTVFGHGGGVVVLRRLSDAVAAGDTIHAVIRGIGLNNDGADKMSYTAPSVAGQAGAISMALRDAAIDADEIGYVEAHGTATPLGDPIEIAGLTRAYGQGKPRRVALGSVKGNLGHTDAAAGAISVIKTALVLREGVIPPVANFKAPNPRIDLVHGPFYVPDGARPWSGEARCAGVSSFGVGGTNAHIVMEAAPEVVATIDADAPQILPLSARSPEALTAMAAGLADALEAPGAPALADVAYTFQEGRRVHRHRLGVAARTVEEAAVALRKARPVQSADARPLVAMFPGQGSQYPGMGRDLYATEPEFARWIDEGCDLLRPLIADDLHRLLTAADLTDKEAAQALRETRLTQPALYMVQFACARLWAARGISPTAMVGHSVGEFAAAAVAGVFSYADGLRIIAERARLMQSMPPGAMLSVRAPMQELDPFLTPTVDLAAQNAPAMQVVAGPEAAIAELEATLTGAGLAAKRLHTSHAFHSAMMDPVTAPLREMIAGLTLSAPRLPLVSAVTGAQLTDEQATDPAFWARQARAPVRFEAAIRAAVQDASAVLVEMGAGGTLSAFAAQTLGRGGHGGIFQSLPDHTQPRGDRDAMASAFSGLWAAGVPVDWSLSGPRGQRKVPLPGTVFQRKRHWVDAPPRASSVPSPVPSPATPPVAASASPVPEVVMSAVPDSRLPSLTTRLIAMFCDLSGEDLTPEDADVPFLELGFDSLFMGQVTQALAREFGVELTFRSLLTDYPSITALAGHLDQVMPPEAAPQPVAVPVSAAAVTETAISPATAAPLTAPTPVQAPVASAASGLATGDIGAVLQAQMQTMQAIFAEQLKALGSGAGPGLVATAANTAAAAAPVQVNQPTVSATGADDAPTLLSTPAVQTPDEPEEKPQGFRTGRGPNLAAAEFTPAQLKFAADLARRYAGMFPKSRAYTAQHRGALADPRTVSGFRPEWKDLVFPVVAERAKGAYIHDVDGHRLIDLVNGFGQTAFGHSPDFVSRAVSAQMERGYPIGPQSDLAGPVAEKFAAATGHQRVTFCNTGSEAVMAAMRLARTVTGREKIAVFSGDYHGQFDEVLVKGKSRGGTPAALPIAPGIPRSGLANMVVLPYGDAARDWLTANMADLAAVIVEPVQSRHPDHRPVEFVRWLAETARAQGTAFVMDEVVTGFRVHPQGAQGDWGIQGDMATYGKVVGGGMPIGVLAGDARWMDALDGGQWSYDDESKPEVAPTFFAGTFVRHPLVLAAVDATLDHIAGEGQSLFTDVADRSGVLAERMRDAVVRRGLPASLVESYSSWHALNTTNHDPRATLLFPLMRMQGVHVLDGFCGFFTTAHVEADYREVEAAFESTLDTLQAEGILKGSASDAAPLPVAASRVESEPAAPLNAPAPTSGIPLTEGQREIWLTHQLGDLPAASFNEGVQMKLDGPLDVPALQAALTDLVARHDALRMIFSRNGETFDIADPYTPDLNPVDVSGEADLARVLDEEGRSPLDLTTAPPFRVRLVRLGETRHILILVAHHIAVDGWSYGTLMQDLAQFYAARCENRALLLPAAPSYAAHALQQSAHPVAPVTSAYWRNVYADIPDLPDLPTDRPRGARKSFAGATTTVTWDADILKLARKAGAKHGCTLFATLFAGLQIVLGRLSGASDIVIGVPTGGQALLPDASLVGHCVNFLPVRAPMETAASAGAHLKSVADRVLTAFDHSRTTYGAIVRDLEVPRSLNRLPLTEVEYNLEKGVDGLRMGALRVETAQVPKAAVNFDLFFNMSESRSGIRIDVNYASDLYDEATVLRWVDHLKTVLAELARDADRPVDEIPVMTEDQTVALIRHQRATQAEATGIVPTTIAAMARAHPDRVAVGDSSGELTYAALMSRVDALAALIQARVPGQGARIAVALPRGIGLVVGLLAVWRAGHAYVPLEPTQPAARLAEITAAAEVSAMLCSGDPDYAQGLTRIDPAEAVSDATPIPVLNDPAATAYVIFTSGSTGRPKGVDVQHRALANFMASMAVEPGLTAVNSMLSVTTVTFDIAALELFGPLCVGGRTVIATREEVLDGFRLVQRLTKGDITHMQATPTLWAMLLEAGFQPGPDLTLLAGGEALPGDLAARLMAGGASLWNLYGPTETTIWSAVRQLEPGQPVTIGHPVAGTTLHVLDANGRVLPTGAVGELNIGGEGLAKGYFNRPDLTAAAFRMIDLGEGPERLYATGDLAQRLPDGDIRVLGRRDGQVKLRGFRIELGEIEARLRAAPGVDHVAVDLRTRSNGDKRLVAWVVPDSAATFDREALSRRLVAELPDYMVPQAWVELSSLPQTANGKLDRKALPDPHDSAIVAPIRAVDAPETDTEKAIASIWADVLGLPEVSVCDTLYALGADSLIVFRIAARMLDAGLGLEARHILVHPTIRQLAAYADSRTGEPAQQRPSLKSFRHGARRASGKEAG